MIGPQKWSQNIFIILWLLAAVWVIYPVHIYARTRYCSFSADHYCVDWLQMTLPVLESEIFWLHVCTVGRNGDTVSIFVYINGVVVFLLFQRTYAFTSNLFTGNTNSALLEKMCMYFNVQAKNCRPTGCFSYLFNLFLLCDSIYFLISILSKKRSKFHHCYQHKFYHDPEDRFTVHPKIRYI